jgi:hypothetical protein
MEGFVITYFNGLFYQWCVGLKVRTMSYYVIDWYFNLKEIIILLIIVLKDIFIAQCDIDVVIWITLTSLYVDFKKE